MESKAKTALLVIGYAFGMFVFGVGIYIATGSANESNANYRMVTNSAIDGNFVFAQDSTLPLMTQKTCWKMAEDMNYVRTPKRNTENMQFMITYYCKKEK